MKLKVLDLFSGLGGFSLGLERAGMETVAFCEADIVSGGLEKFFQENKPNKNVLNKKWPDIPVFGDIKKLKYKEGILYGHDANGKNLSIRISIDVLAGGFPCTDISIAGKKKGFKDDQGKATRSGLWKEYLRLIKEIGPRYVIIENVANLYNIGLAEVIKDLDRIGYVGEGHIISARDIGANHLRKRVWIVAHTSCPGRQQKSRGSHGNERENEQKDNNEPKCDGESNQPGEVQRPLANGYARDTINTSNTNNFRLWQAFTTEKEKQQWWAKTTSGVRGWWKTQSSICRMDDGISDGSHQDS